MAARTATKAPAKTASKSKTAPAKGRAAAKTAPKSAPAAKPATRAKAQPKAEVAAEKPAPKTRAKAAPAAKTETAPKKTPVYPTSIADKKPWQAGSKVNKKTGFTEGTISDKIATALLKGGKSRAEIVNSLPDLPTETRKGTKFQAANVAATVERQMRAMGFQVVQSYKLVPPKRSAA